MVKAIRKGETLKSAKGVPAPSQQDNNGYNPNAIHLSLRFIIGTMLCVSVVAFAVGRLSAILLLRQPDGITTTSRVSTTTDPSRPPRTGILPPPPPPFYLAAPNEIPQTVHGNSKHFRTDALFAVSDARRANPVAAGLVSQQPVNLDGTLSGDNNDDDSYDQQHKTSACQHLLVDIKSAEAAFLNSEDRLGRAMIDLAQLSNLTILNYHCHGREVSMLHCVSVLLEPAHIVLRSWWPIADGISLDLFTCGPKKSSLLSLLPDIERFFGAPQKWFLVSGGDVTDESSVQWAHKKRGFRTEGGNPEDVDLQQYVLGWLEFDTKTLVVSVETKFQTVEIYDVINPRFNSLKSYKKSLSNDGSYEARYPELFRPDRVVYLDGIMQSRRYGDAAYHEALVHPAMISHPKPQRVAIIGGGEGATLREVLKHNTVETVTMIEIDEIMVNVSREHLPEWSDCSMLVGSTPSCFDDQRVEVNFTDAIAWFIERFLDKDKVNESDLYDVIIMDAL